MGGSGNWALPAPNNSPRAQDSRSSYSKLERRSAIILICSPTAAQTPCPPNEKRRLPLVAPGAPIPPQRVSGTHGNLLTPNLVAHSSLYRKSIGQQTTQITRSAAAVADANALVYSANLYLEASLSEGFGGAEQRNGAETGAQWLKNQPRVLGLSSPLTISKGSVPPMEALGPDDRIGR